MTLGWTNWRPIIVLHRHRNEIPRSFGSGELIVGEVHISCGKRTGRSMPRQAFFWKACQDINGEFELDRGHRSVGVAVVTGDDLQDLDAHPEVSHAWLSAIMHVTKLDRS